MESCFHCHRIFTTFSGLGKHVKARHPEMVVAVRSLLTSMTIKDNAQHRARNHFGKASQWECVDCGLMASDWDHINGYDEKNWDNVEPVCRSCHRKREFRRGKLEHMRVIARENGKRQIRTCPHGTVGIGKCRLCSRERARLSKIKGR